MDGREVTVRRVVNIVDKRSAAPRQGLAYDRGFPDGQWYNGPRNFQDEREFREDGNYPQKHCRYFEENPNFGNICRNSTPPRNDGQYSQPYYGRDDLRHQLGTRKNGRPRPYFRQRGVGGPVPKLAADRKAKEDYRISVPGTLKRDHSPVRGEAQPPAPSCSGLNTNSRSFSPDRDNATYQQAQQRPVKPNLLTSQTPSSSVEVSPHSSGSLKEKTPASVVESEEVVTASMEPKPTPDEDFKARRLEAIRAKALEIEKDYRKDCETFRTVVKMLVVKEPSLEHLLQDPLDKNLLELKERCLDSLRHFVKELDEVLEQPDSSSTQATGHALL